MAVTSGRPGCLANAYTIFTLFFSYTVTGANAAPAPAPVAEDDAAAAAPVSGDDSRSIKLPPPVPA